MRVNGQLLSKYVNQQVSIIGTVQSINDSNVSFLLESTDKKSITVNLSQPLGDNVTGLVEVHGICQGPTSINCDYYITFPYTIAHTFDAESDNEVINLACRIPNAWR